jgi:phenylacetate-CoA ligase
MARLEPGGWATRALYRLGDRLSGMRALDRLAELRDMEGWSAAELRRWQDERAREIVAHASRNVPAYRDHWRRHGVDPAAVTGVADLALLPPASKAMLVAAGDAALDQSFPKRRMVQGRSSGSTGARFAYYKTRAHQGWWIAGNFLAWEWAGWQPGQPWVRLQFRGRLSPRQKLEDLLFRCMNMPIDRFDAAFMRASVERMLRVRPTLFRGYAGGAYVFAKWLLEQNETRLRPKAVVVTGDTLYPHYREAIEAAFQSPVYDTYGGEGMTVANQCAHGNYHVLPTVHVDLAPQGPPTPEGQPCLMLLTSLTNTAMPMIRYDIGDVAVAGAGECPCGRRWPVLKRILGRETDIVVTPAGRNLVVHHFNNVMRLYEGIDAFQVVQDEADRITVRLVVNERYSLQRDEPAVLEKLRELAGGGCGVDIERCEEIPVPPSGKRRYVISNVAATSRAAAGAPRSAGMEAS